MSAPKTPPFSAVVETYSHLEPDGTDTWNPLRTDRELLHRLRLYEELCLALRIRADDIQRLRVLDVGCGSGRSTRVYLDFGLAPGQLTGVDLRPGAIEVARGGHPDITYLSYDGETLPIESASVDWVSVCTVMSSIPGHVARRHLADEIDRVMAPDAHVFYWDRERAKRFAGGDRLDPVDLFSSLSVVSDEVVRIEGRLDRYFPGRVLRRTLLPVAERLATPRTHRACVFGKPRHAPGA